MVKANAYGIGMEAVAKALAAAVPPASLAGFGVAAVAEGEALRASGWAGRIVVFTPLLPTETERAAAAGLTPTLADPGAVARWAEAAGRHGPPLPMQVEVDTGMGRSGFPWDAAARWAPEVIRLSGDRVRWEGTFTHFHSADEPDPRSTRVQQERFAAAIAVLGSLLGDRGTGAVHLANSAAAVRCGFRSEWVRPGIFLYGGSVGGDPPRPVVALRARLALVRDVPPGCTLGYGATYTSRRAERWGTLAIGYGDGLPRALGPAGGEALVRGRRVPIIGRISMDMTVVDLSGVPEASAGDVATLIGRDGEEQIGIDAVAERVGTISYEILTGLTARLPRVFLGQSAPAVDAPWAVTSGGWSPAAGGSPG
jgi:alanine racemase